MCGIAGIWSKNLSGEDSRILEAMCLSMRHRGPDDSGHYLDETLMMGHRRLSVIDLSERARQPMSTPDGRYTISYNGEVYNYWDLRKELEKSGIQFHTDSDTEVVLQSFARYGTDCFARFNGMFALAIWDKDNQELVLARDRFGKKPLFYFHNGKERFVFASEISALKKDPAIPFRVDLRSQNCFLAIGYLLNPFSWYEDIYLLEPAHFMRVSKMGKEQRKVRYWDYADAFGHKTGDTESDASQQVLQLLQQAVKRRLVSDVPLGAFLSGGLDSSSIVGLMASDMEETPLTFSAGFRQRHYNELPDAIKVSRFFRTRHHNHYCNFDARLEVLDNALASFDQPFADNSCIPMHGLCEFASRQVTVALSGDGADEIFAGYATYTADMLHAIVSRLPPRIKQRLSQRAWGEKSGKLDWHFKRRQFFNGVQQDYRTAHYLWRCLFGPEARIRILGEENRELVYDTDPWLVFKGYYDRVKDLDKLDQHLYVDAMTWLTDDILVKVDRTSMRHSLEIRAPFLDPDLVAYAASLPTAYKKKRLSGKYILKKAMGEILPKYVLKKKKSGFNAPVHAWLNYEGLNEFQALVKYVFEAAGHSGKSPE